MPPELDTLPAVAEKPRAIAVPAPEPVIRADFRERPQVRGKLFYVGGEPFFIKGVSYGAFRPDEQKREYMDKAMLERDFELMAANGINTVRVPHTMPPRHLLDIAQKHGLHVMVGLSAEQYVGYLIDEGQKESPDVAAIVREKVREVAGHPALLCYGLGNEIAAGPARWLGRQKIERYLHKLYKAIKQVDPEGIVTYVNYPSTEYLQLPFLDVVSFNVYLETRETYKAYLARLQNIAGDRPLLMSEIGLDAYRNGEEAQAESIKWQIRETFASGCAGAVIFSWTDEWHRAGAEVEDWAFGLTRRDRSAKPALAVTTEAFDHAPFPPDVAWPRVSVVVCSYNGSRTIAESLAATERLRYPNYEVIVVNDGSRDNTAEIAARYDCRVVSVPNGGLSAARNIGWQEATGEIVAYLDDDAFPDPYWLQYLAHAFMTTDHAGIGGPNIQPLGVGGVSECVSNSPGGPCHVLITDEIAEHIPGCNMSIRRSCLEAVGGFDPVFRCAGDDVDMCWRLQQMGWTLGFSPGAMVWHHRRHKVRGFWKQQVGYGVAEALLENKWPDKYNSAGHHSFAGRIYGKGVVLSLLKTRRVYHGSGGFAPFQSIYEDAPGVWSSLPLMPEWYLLVPVLIATGALGFFWPPMFVAAALGVMGLLLTLGHGVIKGVNAQFATRPKTGAEALWMHGLTGALHLMQPAARLWGRLKSGLGIWRRRSVGSSRFPRDRAEAQWTEDWVDPGDRYGYLEAQLRQRGAVVKHGDDFDRWDLEVEGGMFGGARFLMAIEDHGAGTQYVRVRTWPRWRRSSRFAMGVCAVMAICAGLTGSWLVGAFFLGVGAMVGLITFQQCAGATGTLLDTVTVHLLGRAP